MKISCIVVLSILNLLVVRMCRCRPRLGKRNNNNSQNLLTSKQSKNCGFFRLKKIYLPVIFISVHRETAGKMKAKQVVRVYTYLLLSGAKLTDCISKSIEQKENSAFPEKNNERAFERSLPVYWACNISRPSFEQFVFSSS